MQKFLTTDNSSCSVKISTLLRKIDSTVSNNENLSIISEFSEYMQKKGSSENHQVNNLKVVMDFAKFLGTLSIYQASKKEQVLSFLDSKIKSTEQDPEKK